MEEKICSRYGDSPRYQRSHRVPKFNKMTPLTARIAPTMERRLG